MAISPCHTVELGALRPPSEAALLWTALFYRTFNKFECGNVVLSDHDSSAAPQTVQTALPVCGAKNFSSVRLYSAPQLH